MRPSISCLMLCLLWAGPALPCTQGQLNFLGASAPTEGDLWPTDGDLWLHYNGPEDGITATLQAAASAPMDLVLTRVDGDIMQADLRGLTPDTDYVIRLDAPSGIFQPRDVRFRSASGPMNSPRVPPRWFADFDVDLESPCSNTGLYVNARILSSAGLHTVAWRLFDAADMRPLGSRLATGVELPFDLRRWVSATGGVRCVRLSAVRANGQVARSLDEFCFPPHSIDAGAGPDADVTPIDAGRTDQDAGQPAIDAGPMLPETRGDLHTAEGGCGCSATQASIGGGYSGGLWGFLAMFILRRSGPRRPAAQG